MQVLIIFYNFVQKILFWTISPTRLLADIVKEGYAHYKGFPLGSKESEARKAEAKAKALKSMNLSYRIISWTILIALILYDFPAGKHCCTWPGIGSFIFWSVIIYCVSRGNEVLVAFCKDSIRVIKGDNPSSSLTTSDRIMLAIHSYICIIIDFAVIYRLLGGKHIDGVMNIFDALYFSVITIATVGYGDLKPETYFGKYFAAFEVFCGMSLVVLTLATYLSQCTSICPPNSEKGVAPD